MPTTTLHRGNLPSNLTTFVGRRSELADAKRQLGEWRLVTLTGIGGVGKTRLALHLASQSDRAFADGAWLVDLAALRDPGLVAHAVATALGLRDDANNWSALVLAEYLADRRVLLVIDNCEHLLDACAVLVDSLLRRAPELRVLATSRQPLGVSGERVLQVRPLTVPDPEHPATSPAALSQYDAVALFVDRAQAVGPSFAVTVENLEAVSKLVQRLDGIPLALELAAARCRVLSPAQILDRLDDGHGLLRSTTRTALPHQRSLKALIDWSFDLCTDSERALWARLTVFPMDLDVEAAEEICCGDGLASEAVLDALAGLVDKSVLIAERTGMRVRYRLPQTLREYGRSLLSDSQDLALRRIHRDYYGRLGSLAWEEWFGPRQVQWTTWMRDEHVNLRAALEFCLADPAEVGAGFEMLPALGLYWSVSGSLGEGRRFLDRALSAKSDPSPGRAKALWVASWVAVHQGDLPAAEQAAEESRRLAQGYNDERAFGHASVYLGMARMVRGDNDSAERLFHEALATAGKANLVGTGAMRRLAEVARQRGDIHEATAGLREIVAICQAHGEHWEQASALWSLAILAWEQGDVDQATALSRESLALRAVFGDRVGIAQCLEVLAWAAAGVGDYDRAGTLLGAADAVWKAVGASLFAYLAHFREDCESIVRQALGEGVFKQSAHKGGARLLAEMVADALDPTKRAAGTRPTAEAGLTARELQIADLVADGLSNREIAAKMVIAQRTAEGHVEHILAKLGFTSRVQIAAWATQRRQGSLD